MEKSYKNILRRSRQRIVDDLDVTDVLDRLLGEEVVGKEQTQRRELDKCQVNCVHHHHLLFTLSVRLN